MCTVRHCVFTNLLITHFTTSTRLIYRSDIVFRWASSGGMRQDRDRSVVQTCMMLNMIKEHTRPMPPEMQPNSIDFVERLYQSEKCFVQISLMHPSLVVPSEPSVFKIWPHSLAYLQEKWWSKQPPMSAEFLAGANTFVDWKRHFFSVLKHLLFQCIIEGKGF